MTGQLTFNNHIENVSRKIAIAIGFFISSGKWADPGGCHSVPGPVSVLTSSITTFWVI